MLSVSIRGLSCGTAEARGDSTGAVLVLVVTCPLLSDRAWGPDVQKTVFSTVAVLPRWPMSLLVQFIDMVWTSLCLCSDVVSHWEVPQIQFIA